MGVRGEGDNRGWDGWMASLTQRTWVWVNSGSWWWTGRPGMLRFMGSQRVGHDWVTELNWLNCLLSMGLLCGKWIPLTGYTVIPNECLNLKASNFFVGSLKWYWHLHSTLQSPLCVILWTSSNLTLGLDYNLKGFWNSDAKSTKNDILQPVQKFVNEEQFKKNRRLN